MSTEGIGIVRRGQPLVLGGITLLDGVGAIMQREGYMPHEEDRE